jgi:hypothetical protein
MPTEQQYQQLAEALARAEGVQFGRPDMFQYFQNELSKAVARFVLAPYLQQLQEKQNAQAQQPSAPADAAPATEQLPST